MRKTAKRIVSAVLAAATVMSLALTASAADYAAAPSYAGTTSQGVSASTEDVSSAVKDTVKSAIASSSDKSGTATVEVATTTNLRVGASVMKELAKSDETVLEIVAPKVTISIDASKIKSTKSLNLSAKVTNSKTKTKIIIGKKKSFGCEVTITLTQCKMSPERLKKAHVYIDGEDKGPVTLNEKGQPVITLTQGGQEVIIK